MSAIRFQAIIDHEHIIRIPAGTSLPQGAVEVSVRPLVNENFELPANGSDPLAPTRSWLLELAAAAELMDPDLPQDLAERHDHYAHGKPIHE